MANLNNLCEKYNITKEEIKQFVDFIYKDKIGYWCGNFNVCVAVTELLTSGDIDKKEEQICLMYKQIYKIGLII